MWTQTTLDLLCWPAPVLWFSGSPSLGSVRLQHFLLSTFSRSVLLSAEAKHEPRANGEYLSWATDSVRWYSEARRALVVPATGFYFVYARTTLRCLDLDMDEMEAVLFKLELHSWNRSYNRSLSLADTWDEADCSHGSGASRTVFLGQIFDLLEGDHISVMVRQGHDLVTKAFFGAYIT